MLPTFDEVCAIAQKPQVRRIPVKRELYADAFTTIEVLRRLRAASEHVFLLESAEPDQHTGRYSFLGFDPSMEITCTRGALTVRRNVESPVFAVGDACSGAQTEERRVEHPGDFLRQVIAENRTPQLEGFPPFTGGLVGYFSYDYMCYSEPTLVRDDLDRADFADLDLMLFDDVICFDSYKQRLILIAAIHVGQDGADEQALKAEYARVEAHLDEMEALVRQGEKRQFAPLELKSKLEPRFSQEQYGEMVQRAKQHIFDGDIFQVVLSNPMTAEANGSLFDAYRVLRSSNPSPYLFYFTSESAEICGASPETLVKLENGRLFTYPLAGTRPRGATAEEDKALEENLLADAKELSEHNMLVDLGRNDLGKIARLGSVEVEKYQEVLRFSHVMHLGSTVSATIDDERFDAVDAVDAVLPAGTLSGAPKIRACQIIADLEGTKRGIYGGAVGYLDFSGNLDTCIGIRLAHKKDGVVCVQSGAGIVYDSDPVREYEECQNKARAVCEALEVAEGGLEA